MKTVRIPQSSLAECRFAANRTSMLNLLPKGGVVAEVGTREGTFSRLILDRTKPAQLHLLDRNWSRFRRENFLNELEAGTVHLHNGDSARGLREFDDGFFDWIYIDAGHDYDHVSRDADAADRKIKANGCLVFNDYIRYTRRGDEYGVIPAVNELLASRKYKMAIFAFQRGGYHDVVLQKLS